MASKSHDDIAAMLEAWAAKIRTMGDAEIPIAGVGFIYSGDLRAKVEIVVSDQVMQPDKFMASVVERMKDAFEAQKQGGFIGTGGRW